MRTIDLINLIGKMRKYNVYADNEVSIHSYQEGYAFLKQHLDRLWNEILLGDSVVHKYTMYIELLNIAYLCFKIIKDLKVTDRQQR